MTTGRVPIEHVESVLAPLLAEEQLRRIRLHPSSPGAPIRAWATLFDCSTRNIHRWKAQRHVPFHALDGLACRLDRHVDELFGLSAGFAEAAAE